ncbi:VCBS repeat-containing protein [Lutibacter sp.]|uniref:VCBS repeat-containing protein n=1 Tax=Lutibacter sp. TaxID=1925666 RepID=UPI001A2C8F66|nr:VCBS repeat-containing protein [Lutibacter sp.]MBI9042077.1 VCBS repeat-containing protein [Lutibacter sp.]
MKIPFQTLLVFILFISCSKDVEPEIIPNYNLKVTVTPTDGGTVTPSDGNYQTGTSVSVLATPSPEYIFKEWNGGVTGTTNPISVTINSNKNITGVFEKRMYPLSITIEGEGTVTEELLSSKPTKDYPSGSVVKLTAIPVDGWEFESWSGDYVGTENPITITVDKSKSLTIQFKKNNELMYKEAILKLRNEVLDIIRPDGNPSWSYSFDLENDGDLDMILILAGPEFGQHKEMILFKNNDNISFESINTGINCWGRNIVFDDFNNDGLIDFFLADSGLDSPPFPGAQDQLIYQTTDGNLIEVTNELLPQISNFSHGCTSIDIEGDGDRDIIVNTGGSQLVLKNNNGVFELWDEGIEPALNIDSYEIQRHPIIDGVLRMDIGDGHISGWWSTSGDFNNDGFDDAIIGCGLQYLDDPADENGLRGRIIDPYGNILNKTNLILLQDPVTGQLIYEYPRSLIKTSFENTGVPSGGIGLLVNDFNKDGCLDLMSYFVDIDHRIDFSIGNCDGTFELSGFYELYKNSIGDSLWEDFEIIDIDDDDDMDVIISNSLQWNNSFESPEEHVVLENINGTFEQRNGKLSDLIFLPPHVGISWYLDGE